MWTWPPIVADDGRGSGSLPFVDVPSSIEVRERSEVILTWDDGTRTVIDARRLRAACPCAECGDPSGMQTTAEALTGPAPVAITSAGLVGAYAISFVFEPDGHDTGIYPFDLLRRLGNG